MKIKTFSVCLVALFVVLVSFVPGASAADPIGDGSKFQCENGEIQKVSSQKTISFKQLKRILNKQIARFRAKLRQVAKKKKAKLKQKITDRKAAKSDGKSCGEGGGSTGTPVPDSGSASASMTNSTTNDTGTCTYSWGTSSFNSPAQFGGGGRLVAGGTFGQLVCSFGNSVTVSSNSFFLAPSSGFGKVVFMGTFIGGSASMTFTRFLEDNTGGGSAGDAGNEEIANGLYGNTVTGIDVNSVQVTVGIDGGSSYEGTFGAPS